MHCEKCGSADTEVVKCGKCGQKSRIQCSNCAFSSCTDKYCEVISIKKKIKILTYFAITLIVLMIFVLPVIFMKVIGDGEKPDPTRKPPTRVASATPTAPATVPASPAAPPTPTVSAPPTPAPPTAPPTPPPPPPTPAGPNPAETRAKVVEAGRSLVTQKVGYKKDATDPSQGGIDYLPLVAWVFAKQGIKVPASLRDLASAGQRITDRAKLEPGDVILFSIKNNDKVSFVGVYTGGGKFVCSYPGKGVLEPDLSNKFFDERYRYAVRIVGP